MRKLLFAGLLLLAVAVPNTASAQFNPLEEICDGTTSDASVCQVDGGNNPIAGEQGIIMRVVSILSYVVGAASVIMIIFGGLKFVTANGDANNISSARNAIIYALVGVVVFLISRLIISFVLSNV